MYYLNVTTTTPNASDTEAFEVFFSAFDRFYQIFNVSIGLIVFFLILILILQLLNDRRTRDF